MSSFTHDASEKTLLVSYCMTYGREAFSPENDLALKFVQLLSQTTFSRVDLENIKKLGYEIKLKEVLL